jgi:hypothetical protein
MGTVKTLAEEVARGLEQAHPKLRKTVIQKLALAVGAMIEGQTPNTVELANLLPLKTERQDMREQWLRRLLKNPLLVAAAVMEPVGPEGVNPGGEEPSNRAAQSGSNRLGGPDGGADGRSRQVQPEDPRPLRQIERTPRRTGHRLAP